MRERYLGDCQDLVCVWARRAPGMVEVERQMVGATPALALSLLSPRTARELYGSMGADNLTPKACATQLCAPKVRRCAVVFKGFDSRPQRPSLRTKEKEEQPIAKTCESICCALLIFTAFAH